MGKSFREISKTDWAPAKGREQTIEAIQLGALLRISDSLESIAREKTLLEDRARRLSSKCERLERSLEISNNRCRGLKGVITKMNRKLEEKKK